MTGIRSGDTVSIEFAQSVGLPPAVIDQYRKLTGRIHEIRREEQLDDTKFNLLADLIAKWRQVDAALLKVLSAGQATIKSRAADLPNVGRRGFLQGVGKAAVIAANPIKLPSILSTIPKLLKTADSIVPPSDMSKSDLLAMAYSRYQKGYDPFKPDDDEARAATMAQGVNIDPAEFASHLQSKELGHSKWRMKQLSRALAGNSRLPEGADYRTVKRLATELVEHRVDKVGHYFYHGGDAKERSDLMFSHKAGGSGETDFDCWVTFMGIQEGLLYVKVRAQSWEWLDSDRVHEAVVPFADLYDTIDWEAQESLGETIDEWAAEDSVQGLQPGEVDETDVYLRAAQTLQPGHTLLSYDKGYGKVKGTSHYAVAKTGPRTYRMWSHKYVGEPDRNSPWQVVHDQLSEDDLQEWIAGRLKQGQQFRTGHGSYYHVPGIPRETSSEED